MAKRDDSVKKKVPELRFAGFADDWEECKLKELFQPSKNKNNNGLYNQKDILAASLGTELIPKRTFFGLKSTKESVKNYRIVKTGDLIYTKSPIKGFPNGIIRSNKGNVGIVPPLYCVYTLQKDINSSIIQLYFEDKNRLNFYLFPLVNVGARNNVNITDLEFLEGKVTIPNSYEEQSKIVQFMEQLNRTIALHQRKLDLLKEQKKGFLQKMFPKNGEKVPELRFAGFADDWEERKFKDIIEKLTGGASIKPSDYLEEGIRTIPKGAVNSTGLADLSGSKYISEEFYESNKSSHVSTNNLVTSLRDLVPSAPNMGRIVRIAGEDEDFLMPQGVYKLELFDGMDEEFLIAFSNSDKYRKIISSEKNGSTQVHIRNEEFLNIDIELPFSEEQKQIGSFFKQLDNSIALHQRKLDLLKEQKKGFLQKMFV